MARKTLADFGYDYQAYANYLESAQCANDDGYTVFGDQNGNVYEALDGDWTKGHSHIKDGSNWPGRSLDDPKSQGRSWKNPWLKYADKLNLTEEEMLLVQALYTMQKNDEVKEIPTMKTR